MFRVAIQESPREKYAVDLWGSKNKKIRRKVSVKTRYTIYLVFFIIF